MLDEQHNRQVEDGAASFPLMNQLLGGYFHQDFDINGGTLEEIMAVCRQDFLPEELERLILEIHRFLDRFGESPESVLAALEQMFDLQVVIDGWEGMNARQWLERVAELAKTS